MPARGGMPGGKEKMYRVCEQVVAVQVSADRQRLVLPLVPEDEVDVADREGRQRLLGLGLDQLAAQPWSVVSERFDRWQREADRNGLEGRDAPAAGDGPGRRGEIGLGERCALEQGIRVGDQDEGGVGQPHATTCAGQQLHPGLAFEHRELLGDGGWRVLQCVGDGGDRPALVELAQQAQPAEIEHCAATLPNFPKESASLVALSGASMPGVSPSGALMVILSAAAFGAMAVFGRLAYEEGATVGTLLAVRFLLAALVSWAVVLRTRAGAAEVRSCSRRDVGLALGLGAFGYAGQAGGYFSALERIDASLLSLLVYTYPAIVTVAAIGLGRERLDGRRMIALAFTFGGLVLVLSGAKMGALDPLGTALAIGTALVYSVYILTSERVAARVAPRVLAALVCTGAGGTLTVASLALGELRPGAVSIAGWGWLVSLAIVSTVMAIALFFAGLRRVGPTNAAILSTVEPLVTVVLAMLVFGEVLGPVQVLGGASMLGGVLVLQVRVARLAHATA